MGLKHILTSVRKCKGMNPNSFKWIPTLRIGVLWVSQIFVTKVHIENLVSIDLYLSHWKGLQMKILKWTCIFHLEIESSNYELNCVLTLALGLRSMLRYKRGRRLGEFVETHTFWVWKNCKSGESQTFWNGNHLWSSKLFQILAAKSVDDKSYSNWTNFTLLKCFWNVDIKGVGGGGITTQPLEAKAKASIETSSKLSTTSMKPYPQSTYSLILLAI